MTPGALSKRRRPARAAGSPAGSCRVRSRGAPSGYDLTTLAAAVYARGWAYRIDRSAGSFQAEIRAQRDGATQPLGAKSGWTADVALAFALAHALVRQAERSGQPLSVAT